jgi:hypothetical protein
MVNFLRTKDHGFSPLYNNIVLWNHFYKRKQITLIYLFLVSVLNNLWITSLKMDIIYWNKIVLHTEKSISSSPSFLPPFISFPIFYFFLNFSPWSAFKPYQFLVSSLLLSLSFIFPFFSLNRHFSWLSNLNFSLFNAYDICHIFNVFFSLNIINNFYLF